MTEIKLDTEMVTESDVQSQMLQILSAGDQLVQLNLSPSVSVTFPKPLKMWRALQCSQHDCLTSSRRETD